MSYETKNFLPNNIKLDKLFKFLELNNFIQDPIDKQAVNNIISSFFLFDEKDYKSWTGIELTVSKNEQQLIVYTRTNLSRSYWDLEYQNKIVQDIKSYFGGYFITDEGKNRILKPHNNPILPSQSGCYLAFQRFEINIGKALIYLQNRQFANAYERSGLDYLDNMNPKILSNNLLLPFLVSILEDYFKSTYIALLKYSENKEKIIKDNNRISTENLLKIANQVLELEEVISESMSFQNIELIAKHFQKLDTNIDLKGVLSKPFKNRKKNLFESINDLVQRRHQFVHSCMMDLDFDEQVLKKSIDDIKLSIQIFHKNLSQCYSWNENVYFNGEY